MISAWCPSLYEDHEHCHHWKAKGEPCCHCGHPPLLPEEPATPVERLTMRQMLQREARERLGLLRRLARRMLQVMQ